MYNSPYFCKDGNYLKKFPRVSSSYAWNKKREIVGSMVDNISYNRILDVGCGGGQQLKSYVKEGVFGVGLILI